MPDGTSKVYDSAADGATGKQLCATVAFFGLVLPDAGHLCIATPNGKGGFKHLWADDFATAARIALALDARGLDAYYAMAGFSDAALDKERGADGKLIRGGRKQANVAALRSGWDDVDCGEGKPYPDAAAGMAALDRFIAQSRLDDPYVVASGCGLHVYWVMDRDVTRAEWKPPAFGRKALMAKLGFHVDPSRTTDEASVLRPVGTTHRKDPANPKPVRMVREGRVWKFEDFAAQIAEDMRHFKVDMEQPGKAKPRLNSELWSGGDFLPASAHKIADRCPVIRFVRDMQGNVDQTLWYRTLGIAGFCVNGDQIAQDWSCGHPDYTPGEVQTKLEQVRRFGPTTCAKLRECQPGLCQGCRFNGQLLSPIRLGYGQGGAELQRLQQPQQQAKQGKKPGKSWVSAGSAASAGWRVR